MVILRCDKKPHRSQQWTWVVLLGKGEKEDEREVKVPCR